MTPGESPYRFEQSDGCSIISLLPELYEAQWADIERVGNDLLARLKSLQSPSFLVDLSALNYMGSAMVALIVRLWKSAKEQKSNMVVVNRDDLVLEVLKLAGLTKLWTIVDSREKGLAELGVSGRIFGGAEGGPGLVVLAVVAVLGAVAGLAMQFWVSAPGMGGKIAQAVEFGFAALGLVAGTMMLVREGSSLRRNIGIFVLVACVLVVLIGIIAAPTGAAPAPAAASAKSQQMPDAAAATPPKEEKKKRDRNKDKEDGKAAAVAAENVADKAAGAAPAAEQKPSGQTDEKPTAVTPTKDLKLNLNKRNQ